MPLDYVLEVRSKHKFRSITFRSLLFLALLGYLDATECTKSAKTGVGVAYATTTTMHSWPYSGHCMNNARLLGFVDFVDLRQECTRIKVLKKVTK